MYLEGALDAVFSSEVYEKLSVPTTALYNEGPAYLYSYLQDELGKERIE